MKEYIEKLLVCAVPFLLVVSICYNNGYWSPYAINIYDYYQVTDILKAIALPSFSFVSFLFIPAIIISGVLLSFKKPSEEDKKIKEGLFNVDEIKSNFFRAIVRVIGIAYIFGYSTYFIIFISYVFSSYFDDNIYSLMYLKSMPNSLQGSIVILVLYPFFYP